MMNCMMRWNNNNSLDMGRFTVSSADDGYLTGQGWERVAAKQAQRGKVQTKHQHLLLHSARK